MNELAYKIGLMFMIAILAFAPKLLLVIVAGLTWLVM